MAEKTESSAAPELKQDPEAKTGRKNVTCDRCQAEFPKPTYVEDRMTCPNCGMETKV